jgi:hypothetical protein
MAVWRSTRARLRSGGCEEDESHLTFESGSIVDVVSMCGHSLLTLP